MAKYYQGKFNPKNPHKYKGDFTNIIYRSGWELKLMSYLDKHPHVTKWNSEEIIIPYRSCVDGKMHRYFPDFYVEKIPHMRLQSFTYKIAIIYMRLQSFTQYGCNACAGDNLHPHGRIIDFLACREFEDHAAGGRAWQGDIYA